MLIKLLFWINISLFILHEMDAVKTCEWKMMIFMKRLSNDTGHFVFTALHLPIFMIIFYLTDCYPEYMIPSFSILLIIHQIVHILFRKHTENRMNNLFSESIIFLMFINSSLTLYLYFSFFRNNVFYFR